MGTPLPPAYLISFFLGACILLAPIAQGFKGGAPPSQCESMKPAHGSPIQTSPLPYVANISSLDVKGGEKIMITLMAPQSQHFKGFFAQVKKKNVDGKNYGQFNPTYSLKDSQAVDCFNNPQSAMTHRANDDKSSVTLEWTAPNEDHADLHLTVTFVKDYSTYWVHHTHKDPLKVSKDLTYTTPAPAKQISSEIRTKLKAQYSGCDKKGCLGHPSGCVEDFEITKDDPIPTTCKILLTWKAAGDRNVYNLVGKPGVASGYIAMAFSQDNKMGQDSVVGCYLEGSNPVIQRFYNPATRNEKVQNPNLGVKPISKEFSDGFLFCEFEQSDHNLGGMDYSPKSDNYILLSRSTSASSEGLGHHNQDDKVVSVQALSITDVGIFGGKDGGPLLYQLHGCFMILAWLLCASTGMFTARYYKQTFTTSMPFSKPFWFALHVTCMFSTAFLTACGAIIIIVKKEGFQFMNGDDPMWHPILGVILFGLALLQVLIAFFRPHPGTPKRPLFNWVHWTIGNSAHIIGIACIFLAKDLSAANLKDDVYTYITGAAVLFHIVMHIIMSFHTLWADSHMDIKSKRAVVPGPMKPNGLSSEAPGTPFRTFMMLLYILGLMGCVAALLYFVWRPQEKEDNTKQS